MSALPRTAACSRVLATRSRRRWCTAGQDPTLPSRSSLRVSSAVNQQTKLSKTSFAACRGCFEFARRLRYHERSSTFRRPYPAGGVGSADVVDDGTHLYRNVPSINIHRSGAGATPCAPRVWLQRVNANSLRLGMCPAVATDSAERSRSGTASTRRGWHELGTRVLDTTRLGTSVQRALWRPGAGAASETHENVMRGRAYSPAEGTLGIRWNV